MTTTTTAVVVTTTAAPPMTATTGLPAGLPAAGDDSSVVRVVDGDTVEVTGGTRARLIGVDTPETVDPGRPVECFGPEATRYAKELLPAGTRVRLVYDVQRRDSFGRTLAYVYKLGDGVFVNLALARNGYAQQDTVPPNVAHAEQFRAAAANARTADLGLWRACLSPATTTTGAAVRAAPTTPATVARPMPTTAGGRRRRVPPVVLRRMRADGVLRHRLCRRIRQRPGLRQRQALPGRRPGRLPTGRQ